MHDADADRLRAEPRDAALRRQAARASSLPDGADDLRQRAEPQRRHAARPARAVVRVPPGSSTSSFTSGVTEEGRRSTSRSSRPSTIFNLLLGQAGDDRRGQAARARLRLLLPPAVPDHRPARRHVRRRRRRPPRHGLRLRHPRPAASSCRRRTRRACSRASTSPTSTPHGNDRPEGTLTAEIAVGAAISLGFISAGVEGGIAGEHLLQPVRPRQGRQGPPGGARREHHRQRRQPAGDLRRLAASSSSSCART